MPYCLLLSWSKVACLTGCIFWLHSVMQAFVSGLKLGCGFIVKTAIIAL